MEGSEMTENPDAVAPEQPNAIHALIESQYEISKEKYERLSAEYRYVDSEWFYWGGLVRLYGIDLTDSTTATTTPEVTPDA